jgi:predicted secreted protein
VFRTKTALILLLSLALTLEAAAGDQAHFVDLGFSDDGAYYMFAQYGLQGLQAWAEAFIVDTEANDYASPFPLRTEGGIAAGGSAENAFYALLLQNSDAIRPFNISLLKQGRLLYLDALSGGTSEASFRDFQTGSSYTAKLLALETGEGEAMKSSFSIEVQETDAEGRVSDYLVGSPQIWRSMIQSYRIVRVMSYQNCLIFIVETARRASSGYDIRYMAEVLLLPAMARGEAG